MSPLRDGVEPQRNLGQFHSHRIQVHAVHIVVGNVHLHPLPLGHVLVMTNGLHVCPGLLQFLLLLLQVGFSQLVHGFVQERCAAHGRLADGQLQDLVRCFARQNLPQCMVHQATSQNLGRVVAG